MRQDRAALLTVGPKPDEGNSLDSVCLHGEGQKLLQQSVDASINGPARKVYLFPTPQPQSLQLLANGDFKVRANTVIRFAHPACLFPLPAILQAAANVAFAPQVVEHRRRVEGDVAGSPFRPDMVCEITSCLLGCFAIIAQRRLPIADDIRPEAKISFTRAQFSAEGEIRKNFRASEVIHQRFVQARYLPLLNHITPHADTIACPP